MPHIIPSIMAMKFGIKGYVSAPSMSSGAGLQALGDSYRLIRDGHMDAVIVGGLDLNLNENVVCGMESFGALCTSPALLENPEDALRPFDMDRGGTAISDGGSALVLESENFRNKRK
jgi:3-oxoacyl-[acyl-carrier-protein] synthase II